MTAGRPGANRDHLPARGQTATRRSPQGDATDQRSAGRTYLWGDADDQVMFRYQWKCAWGDADPHGITYYPRLVNAMHRAGEEFMDDVGMAYWDIPDEYDVHLPIVAVDLEFERPVRVGDVLDIAVDPDVGDTSLGLSFTATHEDGTQAFTGSERHVCVSTADNESRPLPTPLTEAIESEA